MFVPLRMSERKGVLILVDLALANLATFLSLWIHASRMNDVLSFSYLVERIEWFVFLSLLWLTAAYFNRLYDPVRVADFETSVLLLSRTVLIVIVVYLVVFFYTAPRNLLPRGIVVYQSIAGFVFIGSWRLIYVLFQRNPEFARKIIIVGAGWSGKTIAELILRHATYQYKIVGFVDDDASKQGTEVEISWKEACQGFRGRKKGESFQKHFWTLPVLGTSEDLSTLVTENNVIEVVLAVTHDIGDGLFRALMDCKELGISITLMPILSEELTGRIPIEHIGENWYVALPLYSAETSGFYSFANRLFDFVAALFGIFLLLPIFPIIALAIYLDSPGPIFYSQERVGKGGEIFELYKLRTMIPEAEEDGKAMRAQEDDPRITRVGRLLRKLRLDEMPQLVNILKGDMSAVGPRPERPMHLTELDQKIPYHRLRNAVKPGMAGWAVVNYGYIDSIEAAKMRLQYDLYYVKHQSLWLDIIILLRTFGQIITLKGR